MRDEASTPLMRQYQAIKQQAPNALLMFRLGDFYELFYEDAVTAARELDITLTSRNKEKGAPIPMCGVPAHAAESYIARLVQRGFRVALCEQMEDPRLAKKLVRREITRVVTPGTATEVGVVRSKENNYLAAVTIRGTQAGMAYVDVSTGEFRMTEVSAAEALGVLEQIRAREVLVAEGTQLGTESLETALEGWVFDYDYAERILREHFGLLSLDGCGAAGRPLAVSAAGAILHYLRDTQKSTFDHLERPRFYDRSEAMVLDAATVRNLELFEPLFAGESREATLISVLDETSTAMGARLLRQRLLRPSIEPAEIEARLDAVEEMAQETIRRAEIRKVLEAVGDLERLLARVTLGTATPRDLLALGRSLEKTEGLRFEMRSRRLRELCERLDPAPEVVGRILGALAEEPPIHVADGGVIREGYHAELDELRSISRNSRQYLAAIEARERQRTGIGSLKVRFNNVFGYYIEVSKANLQHVPADYERKQTLVNAERFTTPELKELEAKILSADERALELERQLFAELRAFTAQHAARIRATAAAVAELDLTAALAEVAVRHGYRRPRFSAAGEMKIIGGRHPVVERLLERQAARFVPNDVYLDSRTQFISLITGPNMGGKSTYLRQAALICILAQAGCFVPAEEAVLPLVDRVFTRVGATDNLARGRSTFMVEMTETAVILNTATERSLIVLDEVGRGTSTYDGLALAWAVVEYIHERIRAKTLFATHYHELTALAERLPGVRNLHVEVKEAGDQILFLRRVAPGAADRSYGIEVARLAALPQEVIERAREILALHERAEVNLSEQLEAHAAAGPLQIRLFEPVNGQMAERIRKLKLDEIRPIEALQILAELQRDLSGG
jgi:DNA mismatch repair protein MutS